MPPITAQSRFYCSHGFGSSSSTTEFVWLPDSHRRCCIPYRCVALIGYCRDDTCRTSCVRLLSSTHRSNPESAALRQKKGAPFMQRQSPCQMLPEQQVGIEGLHRWRQIQHRWIRKSLDCKIRQVLYAHIIWALMGRWDAGGRWKESE